MVNINKFRHPKESFFFNMAAILGGLTWLLLLLGLKFALLGMVAAMAFATWVGQQFFKAEIYGNAVRVSERQYPDLHQMVQQSARELGLANVPDVFVMSGSGALNALAIKFIGQQYVILFAELVDLMLQKQQHTELKMVIAHELGHHAAGHTDWKINLLLMPVMWLPYVGGAYRRACEFTADRLGAAVVKDIEASKRALLTLAAGSQALTTNIEAFAQQEDDIPGFFGTINELYSTHPRMTRRVRELDNCASLLPRHTAPLARAQARVPAARQAAVQEEIS